MLAYIIRRLLLIVPTLVGIVVINFLVIQVAPGGPVEQTIAKLTGSAVDPTARIAGSQGGEISGAQSATAAAASEVAGKYRGARGLRPELIKEIEKQYGFDKPLGERLLKMLNDYAHFDFGKSFYKDRSVVSLIFEKLPVSISLGLWTTILTYLISIPLGIAKAVRDGARFDIWTSAVLIVGNAIPSFMFAILLIVLFAGGSYLDWFPLRGLVSNNWSALPFWAQIGDYFWHLALPLFAMMIGGFTSLTMLTKNSFIEEIGKQYVITARAKGLSERRVLYGHVFRNAMLIVISGMPGAFIGILFTSAFLIEVIFSLDGLGLLGYESLISRDYPVIFGSLFIFTLIGLAVKLIGDLTYVMVDPRIDFERREV
jgi:microcin C transport system permease protein